MAGPNVRIPVDFSGGPCGVQTSAVSWYRTQVPLNPNWFTGSARRAYLEVAYVNNYGSDLTCSIYYNTTINSQSGSTKLTDFTLTNQGNTNVVWQRSSDLWSSLYNGLAYYYLYTPAGGTTAYMRMLRLVIEVEGATAVAIPITLVESPSGTGTADTATQIRQTASATYPTEMNSDTSTAIAAAHWKYDSAEWSDLTGWEIDYLLYSNTTSSAREGMAGIGEVGQSTVLSGTEQTATLDTTAPRLYRITGLSSSLFTDESVYQVKVKNENSSYVGRLPMCRLWAKLSNANGLTNFPIYELVAGTGNGTSASSLEGTKGKYESSKWSSTSGTQTMTRYFESTFAQDTASPQNGMELVDDDSGTGGTYNNSITNTQIAPPANSTYNVDPGRTRSSAFTFPNDNYYYYARRLATTTSTYYFGAYLVHRVAFAPAAQASGTITTTSGASGSITAKHVAAGTAAASSTNSGAVTARRVVSGTVAGTSGLSGQAVRITAAAGVVAATSGINGAVFKRGPAAGTVAGTAAVPAASVTAKHVMAGTAPATSGVSGAAIAKKVVSASVAGTGGASGAVTAKHVMAGTVAAISGVSGAATKRTATSGTVAATSGVSGDATRVPASGFPAAGTVAATAGASGAVTAKHVMAGTAAASSAASASITAKRVSSGTVAATAGASASITAKHVMAGSVAGTSGVSATVLRKLAVSSTNSAVSGVSLAVTAKRVCSGIVAAVSALSGAVTVITGGGGTSYPASGTVAATSGASGATKDGFLSFIADLLPNTHYFLRAYATNDVGTSYGTVREFTTLVEPLPVSGTVAAVSAVSGAARTHFISTMSPLVDNQHYYVRAYATNASGTSYGSVQEFDTGTGKDVSGTAAAVSGASANVGLESTFKGLMGLLLPARDVTTLTTQGTVAATSGASGSVTATHVVSGVAAAQSTFGGIVAFIPVYKGFLGLMGLLLISSEPLPKEAVGTASAVAGTSMSVTAVHEVAGMTSAVSECAATVGATAQQEYPPDIIMRAYLENSSWDFDGTIESAWSFFMEDRVFSAEEQADKWVGTLLHE